MKFKTLLIFLFFSILLFVGCDSKDENKKSASSNKNAKVFTLNTLDDSSIKISLEDDKILLEGSNEKLVLLNFFTTWCPACKVEIANLVRLQESFQNDLVVVGILLEDFKTNDEIREFMGKFGTNYKVTNSNEAFELAKFLGGLKAVPTLFLLDKNGEIFQKYTGLVPNEMMEVDIKKLLER